MTPKTHGFGVQTKLKKLGEKVLLDTDDFDMDLSIGSIIESKRISKLDLSVPYLNKQKAKDNSNHQDENPFQHAQQKHTKKQKPQKKKKSKRIESVKENSNILNVESSEAVPSSKQIAPEQEKRKMGGKKDLEEVLKGGVGKIEIGNYSHNIKNLTINVHNFNSITPPVELERCQEHIEASSLSFPSKDDLYLPPSSNTKLHTSTTQPTSPTTQVTPPNPTTHTHSSSQNTITTKPKTHTKNNTNTNTKTAAKTQNKIKACVNYGNSNTNSRDDDNKKKINVREDCLFEKSVDCEDVRGNRKCKQELEELDVMERFSHLRESRRGNDSIVTMEVGPSNKRSLSADKELRRLRQKEQESHNHQIGGFNNNLDLSNSGSNKNGNNGNPGKTKRSKSKCKTQRNHTQRHLVFLFLVSSLLFID